MKPLSTLLSLVLAVSVLSTAYAQATTSPLIAGVADNPPSSWQENGSWRGMNIEIYQALAKASGLAVGFANLLGAPGVENLKNGACSILAEVAKSEEQAADMHFLGPYGHRDQVLVVRREDLPALQVDNLQMLLTQSRARGLKVGIEREVFYGSEFKLRLEKDPAFQASFEYVNDQLAEKMNGKQLLAYLASRPLAVHAIRHNREFANLAIHPFTVNRTPLYLAVSKSVAPETLTRLQQAMATLTKDGSFAAIAAKWEGR